MPDHMAILKRSLQLVEERVVWDVMRALEAQRCPHVASSVCIVRRYEPETMRYVWQHGDNPEAVFAPDIPLHNESRAEYYAAVQAWLESVHEYERRGLVLTDA